MSISASKWKNLKKLLLSEFKTLTECFSNYHMIINPDRCSFMWLFKNIKDNYTSSFNVFNLKKSKKDKNKN